MAKTTVVRVLAALFIQGQCYQPNSLVEFAEDELKKIGKDAVDACEEAVAYVKNELKAEIIKHKSAEVDPVLSPVDPAAPLVDPVAPIVNPVSPPVDPVFPTVDPVPPVVDPLVPIAPKSE